jgi:hypothetical protein
MSFTCGKILLSNYEVDEDFWYITYWHLATDRYTVGALDQMAEHV